MNARLAWRSLWTRPVRSVVLAVGFGLGVGVMAGLLGVGEVILDQARSPHLRGGGDVVLRGWTGAVPNTRYLLAHVLRTERFAGRVRAASPSTTTTLYLLPEDGPPTAIDARGVIPDLARALDDPELASVPAWTATAADRAWAAPGLADLLRRFDRFHPVPDIGRWRDSWAEWLYFNGQAGDRKFYLTFLVGPETATGMRAAGVRLQLEQDGRLVQWSSRDELPESAVLAGAPDLVIAACSVRLEGTRYDIDLRFDAAESDTPGAGAIAGVLSLEAVPGRSMPPFTIRGAEGWRSGYVVPVLSGPVAGSLVVGGRAVSFEGGTGYHDHNWGSWEAVSWRWGQVAHGDLSFVYGRVFPPVEVADPDRTPGFLGVLGPDGPLGFSRAVRIREVDDPATGLPRAIEVEARGSGLELAMRLTVGSHVRNRWGGQERPAGALDLVQMRARYVVEGEVAGRSIAFEADGAAETFREPGP